MFVKMGYNVKFIPDNFNRSEPYTATLQQMGIEVLYGPWYAQHWKEWVKENADHIQYVSSDGRTFVRYAKKSGEEIK